MGQEVPVMGGEFELSLELSIGGCYAKPETKNPERETDGDREKNSRSDFWLGGIKTDVVGAENSREFPDLPTRREIEASRRSEPRMLKSRGGGCDGDDDRLILKAQQFHARVEERESRERDGVLRKREKAGARKAAKNLNNVDISLFGENKVSEKQLPLPVVDGFACPWVLPLWGDEAAAPPNSVHRSTSQKGGSCCSDSGSPSSSFGTPQNPDGNNSCSSQTECIASQDQSTSKSKSTSVVPSTTRKVALEPNPGSTMRGDHEKPASTSPRATPSLINTPPKLTKNALNMPFVSTTFDGKTITGFLYKYTKSEVTILCVCHGTFFTPAEFVEHAGAVHITHPLRHITVLPSPLH